MNRFMRDMFGPNIRFFAEGDTGGDGDGSGGAGDGDIVTKAAVKPDITTGDVTKPWTDGVKGWDDATKTSMGKFKTAEDAAVGYVELQKKMGTMIAPPGTETDPVKANAQHRDFLVKSGLMPETKEQYVMDYPAELPEERQMGDRETEEFKVFADGQNYTQGQVKELLGFMTNQALASDRMATPNAIKNASAYIHEHCPDDAQEIAQFARQLTEEHGGEGMLDMVFAPNGQPINGPLCEMLGRIGEQAYGTQPFHQGSQQQQVEMRRNSLKMKQRYPRTPQD